MCATEIPVVSTLSVWHHRIFLYVKLLSKFKRKIFMNKFHSCFSLHSNNEGTKWKNYIHSTLISTTQNHQKPWEESNDTDIPLLNGGVHAREELIWKLKRNRWSDNLSNAFILWIRCVHCIRCYQSQICVTRQK